MPVANVSPIHDLLLVEGYRLIEDAWSEHGRRTYIHDDDASPAFVRMLAAKLRSVGWDIDRNNLRTLRHSVSGEIIELEPGGPDTSGHFLHHMKALD
jgi:hypothetical protein